MNHSIAANTSNNLATGNLCDNPGKKGQVNSETTTQEKGWYLQPTQVTQVVQLLQDGTSVHKIAVTLWRHSLNLKLRLHLALAQQNWTTEEQENVLWFDESQLYSSM